MTSTTGTTGTDQIMPRLREETADLHRYAESRPLQKAMAKGAVTRGMYVAYLGQLLLVHRALETQLDRARDEHPAFDVVWQESRRRVPGLVADLAAHGSDLSALAPLPATARVVNDIESAGRERPLALLGALYVLEGSTNGNAFLARVLGRVFGIAPGAAGLRTFDPYGDAQRQHWEAFKDDMGGAPYTAAESDAIVAGAKRMFEGIAAISDDVNGR